MKTSHSKLLFSLMAVLFLSTAYIPVAVKDGGKEKEFKQFLSYFDAVNLPYQLSLSEVETFVKKAQVPRNKVFTKEEMKQQNEDNHTKRERSKAISNTDFLPEAYQGFISRMGPPIFEPMAQFELNDNMIGVVYASTMRYMNFTKSYKLLIYNKKGEILNIESPTKKTKSKIFAGARNNAFLLAQTGIEQSSSFKIDEKGHIWKNTYQHEWANDLRTCPIEENTLVNSKLTDTKVFKVNTKGQIEEMEEYPTVAKACVP